MAAIHESAIEERVTALEKKIKNLEDWGNGTAIIGNYNASRIHAMEVKIINLVKKLEDLEKKFEGSR